MLGATVTIWLVLAGLAVTGGLCLVPHRLSPVDDEGDGLGVVRIPRPAAAVHYRRRLFAFYAIAAVGIVLLDGLRTDNPARLLEDAISRVATAMTGRPAEVQGYLASFPSRLTLLWVVAIVALGLVLRATWGRRLLVMAHAALYVVMAIALESLAIAASIRWALPFRPANLAMFLVNLVVGVLVTMRVMLTAFVLPAPNRLPVTRRPYRADAVVTLAFAVVAAGVPLSAVIWVGSPSFAGSQWQRFVPLAMLTVVFAIAGAGLLMFRGGRSRLPAPLADPPPIDVITPAFNEAAGIEQTLASIDRAAARYGGRVRAIVSNDGSTDGTEVIALEAMRRFRHAEGVVITHPNTGKAGALNRALEAATSEIVVRLDGDCMLAEDILRYVAPWFADPEVGIVGAVMLPRDDCRSWYARMRGVECLLGFGCTRMGEQVVDGVTVVPGTFTAFRREPMIASGGFVEGMNGEDADQTCQFGRMGYRVVLDPRAVAYEDVPPNLPEFVEQRTRWARAGLHVFARHNPVRNGLAGPRVWFYLWRRTMIWADSPLFLIVPLYVLLALGGVVERSSALYLVVLPAVVALFTLAITVAAAARYRYWRPVAWFPTFLIFTFVRRIALMEALLSLPCRPVLRADRRLPVPPAPLRVAPVVTSVRPEPAVSVLGSS